MVFGNDAMFLQCVLTYGQLESLFLVECGGQCVGNVAAEFVCMVILSSDRVTYIRFFFFF